MEDKRCSLEIKAIENHIALQNRVIKYLRDENKKLKNELKSLKKSLIASDNEAIYIFKGGKNW